MSVGDTLSEWIRVQASLPTGRYQEQAGRIYEYVRILTNNVSRIAATAATKSPGTLNYQQKLTTFTHSINAFITNDMRNFLLLLKSATTGSAEVWTRMDAFLEAMEERLKALDKELDEVRAVFEKEAGRTVAGWQNAEDMPEDPPKPLSIWWYIIGGVGLYFGGRWLYEQLSGEYPRHKLPGYAKR